LLFHLEAPVEHLPILAIDRLRGVKERRASVQELSASGEPGVDVEPNLVAGKVELALGSPVNVVFDVQRSEHGEGQTRHQHTQYAPDITWGWALQQVDRAFG